VLRWGALRPLRSKPAIVAGPAFDDASALGDTSRAEPLLPKTQFTPLPGAAREATEMRGVLEPDKFLVGGAATEEAMRALRGPSVLHVATHGFFLEGEARVPRGGRALVLDVRAQKATLLPSDALLRAGLALAGANARHAPPDDGILTAMEASSLDLWGTRLVTLSACETGVGDTGGREGIAGLRRALLVAGSQSQLTSLWSVDDDATVTLMRGFYGRLKQRESRAEALRSAQRDVAASAQTAHPYFWAAFVLSGDPRSFDGREDTAPEVPAVEPKRGCGCTSAGAAEAAPWLAVVTALFIFVRRRSTAKEKQ
jgi:MYXO-CTERM domain-containing protein